MRKTEPALTVVALALLLAGGVPVAAQVHTEVTIADISVEEPLSPLLVLEQRVRDADATHLRTGDDGAAIAELTALIAELQALTPRAGTAPADESRRRAALAQAFFTRARAQFNRDNIAEVDSDFEQLLRSEPGFRVPAGIPQDLGALFSQVRQDRIGSVELVLDPPDARIFIDDLEVDTGAGPLALYQGVHNLRAERLGCRGAAVDRLEVIAGQAVRLSLSLVRESAVLRLQTTPPGARIVLGGQEIGVTEGGEVGVSPPLLIQGLVAGRHPIEVQKAGFRTHRSQVEVLQLADYDLGVVALEPEIGTIRLRNLPVGATIRLNGAAASPATTGAREGVLRLPPGEHRIFVDQGAAGIFERRLSLADGDELDLEVVLRAPLALLGILGGDRLQSDGLRANLLQAGSGLGQWILLDRSDTAGAALDDAGLDAQTLRAAARGGLLRRPPDWNALATAAESLAPGSAYLVAVLDDDLYASEVDLWFVPARSVMSPVRPFRQRLDLDDTAGIGAALTNFDNPVAVERPWLGALFIDSGAAAGPVVMDVTADSPAAASGLRVGDEIRAVWNQPVTTTAEVEAILDRLQPGFELGMVVVRPTGTERQITVRLGSSPVVFEANDPRLNHVALLVNLTGEVRDGGDAPEWLHRLNLAAVLMWIRTWDPAVRELKRVQAPGGPGLGQAAADYWLARALLAVGPRFTNQAREKLEAAVAVPGARLYHHDGPLVAPRARALLAQLPSQD
jgi:hypothetical protein